MAGKSPITTHVLDLSIGRPASAVTVSLERRAETGQWEPLATGATNEDGRWLDALPVNAAVVGRYRLTFATGEYFGRRNQRCFYPSVSVEFLVEGADEHYHVPLLLGPFGYSTYRGS